VDEFSPLAIKFTQSPYHLRKGCFRLGIAATGRVFSEIGKMRSADSNNRDSADRLGCGEL